MVNQGQPADEDAGDVIGDDASLAVTAAAKENLASWRQPGAFEGDRSYSFGIFPATGAAMLNLEEVVVHNWDVAKGTGQELVIDPAVGQMIYDWASRSRSTTSATMAPSARSGGVGVSFHCRPSRRLARPATVKDGRCTPSRPRHRRDDEAVRAVLPVAQPWRPAFPVVAAACLGAGAHSDLAKPNNYQLATTDMKEASLGRWSCSR